jgi:hypothetical protein
MSMPATGFEGFPYVTAEEVNLGKNVAGVGNSLGFKRLGNQRISVVDAFCFFVDCPDPAFAGFQ